MCGIVLHVLSVATDDGTRFYQHKCIVLCTHYLDEADLLGDRIGIMRNGHMFCSGSSLFLKHKFGLGFHLTAKLTAAGDGDIAPDDQACTAVAQLVQKHVPSASVLNASAATVALKLPHGQTSQYGDMLNDLSSHKKQLGIVEYVQILSCAVPSHGSA